MMAKASDSKTKRKAIENNSSIVCPALFIFAKGQCIK